MSVALSCAGLAVRRALCELPQPLDLLLLLETTQVGRRTVRLGCPLAARDDRAARARPPLLRSLPRAVLLDLHAVLALVVRAEREGVVVLVHLVVVVLGTAFPADETARLGEHRRALLERRRVVARLLQARRHLGQGARLLLTRDDRPVLQLVLLEVLEPEQRLLVADRRSGSPDRVLIRVDIRLRVVEAGSLEPLLLGLERVELGDNVGVDEVGDVLAVLDLGDDIVLPLVVLEEVVLYGERVLVGSVDVSYPRTPDAAHS